MDLIASIYGTHGDDEDDCTNTEVSANEKKRKRVVSEAELRVKKTLGKLEVDLPDFFNASDKGTEFIYWFDLFVCLGFFSFFFPFLPSFLPSSSTLS
jgi:hypothetical protein